jgi:hypothetical protein
MVLTLFLAACAGVGYLALNEPTIYLKSVPWGLGAASVASLAVVIYSIGYMDGRRTVIDVSGWPEQPLPNVWDSSLPLMLAFIGLCAWSVLMAFIAQQKIK